MIQNFNNTNSSNIKAPEMQQTDSQNPITDTSRSNSLFKKNYSTIIKANKEMSASLCNSIMHLDDICLRVKNCLEDIKRNNQRYEMLRTVAKEDVTNDDIKEITSRISLHNYVTSLKCNERPEEILPNAETRLEEPSLTYDLPEQAVEPIKNDVKDVQLKDSVNDLDTKPQVQKPKLTKNKKKPQPKGPSKTEIKLRYLKNAIAQIPPGHKRERLMCLLSYTSLSNQARVELVNRLNSRTSMVTIKRSKPNVIDLPKKPKDFKRTFVDERFSDSLFFAQTKPIKQKQKFRRPQVDVKSIKLDKKSVTATNSTPVSTPSRQLKNFKNFNNSNSLNDLNANMNNDVKADTNIGNNATDNMQQQIQCIRNTVIDSLDNLREQDLEPIASEYPRKDNIYYNRLNNFGKTFLYKLTSTNNDKLLRFLLTVPERVKSLEVESNEAWDEYSQQRRRRREAILSKLRPLLAQIRAKKKLSASTHEIPSKKRHVQQKNRSTSLASLIVDPSINHFQTYTVMPVHVTYSSCTMRKKNDSKPATPTQWYNDNYETGYKVFENKIIKPKVNTRLPTEYHAKTLKLSSKKLQNNKYKKSVSENLIKYVSQQKPLYNYIEKQDSMQNITTPINQPLPRFSQTNYINQKHLGKDISRIVSTIEQKIVKVLSNPIENQTEFTEIEREINDVLCFMQRMKNNNTDDVEKKVQLPALISVNNSENPLGEKLSATSYQTVNSSVSQNSVPNFKEGNNNTAEQFCDSILKEIEKTKEDLRRIQEDEYLRDLEESNKTLTNVIAVTSQENLTNTEDLAEGKVNKKDEEDKMEEAKADEEREKVEEEIKVLDEEEEERSPADLQANDYEQAYKNIEEMFLSLQEMVFEDSEIDYENSNVYKIKSTETVNEINQDDLSEIGKHKSCMQIHERVLKSTINQRIQEINETKRRLAVDQEQESNSCDTEEENVNEINDLVENKSEENVKENTQSGIIKTASGFLTPYFQAIKKYREKLNSSSTPNVLDFLDKLTNMASDNKKISLHARQMLRKATISIKPQIYGLAIYEYEPYYNFMSAWDNVEIYMDTSSRSTSSSERNLSCNSPKVLSPIGNIKKLVDSLNAFNELSSSKPQTSMSKKKKKPKKKVKQESEKEVKGKTKSNEKHSCGDAKTNNKTIDKKKIKSTKSKIQNANDEEYNSILKAVYGVVFSVMYVGLQMNYSCNSQ